MLKEIFFDYEINLLSSIINHFERRRKKTRAFTFFLNILLCLVIFSSSFIDPTIHVRTCISIGNPIHWDSARVDNYLKNTRIVFDWYFTRFNLTFTVLVRPSRDIDSIDSVSSFFSLSSNEKRKQQTDKSLHFLRTTSNDDEKQTNTTHIDKSRASSSSSLILFVNSRQFERLTH